MKYAKGTLKINTRDGAVILRVENGEDEAEVLLDPDTALITATRLLGASNAAARGQ